MDGHAEAAGDETDDLIAGQRRAALGKLDGAVVDALDDDAVGGVHPLDVHGHRLDLGGLELGVLLFQFGQHTADLQTAVADGRIHLIHRVAVVAAGQRLHKGLVLLIGHRHEVAAQLAFQCLASLLDILFPAFFLEPVADLVLGFAGLYNVQPVAAGAAVFRAGDDLDDLAGLHLMIDGHDAVVDLGADHAVANGGMNGVGKVDRGGTGGQVDDVAPRGESKHFLRQQVALNVAEQVGGISAGALAF